MTKTAFILAYERQLRARYDWAVTHPDKLVKFMQVVANTINGNGTWNFHGEAAEAAWREIGGKGRHTLKALRALPT